MAASKSKSDHRHSSANPTQQLDSRLSTFLSGRLQAGAQVCVGLSGGMDSVVLLHALSRMQQTGVFQIRLSAIHVHHGISPHADGWAAFCAEFCSRCGVPLEVARVSVPRNSGEGLEAAARRLRHGIFVESRADWLALAHHRDDQSETVLLNLLRGAGVAGAAGMLAERPQAQGPALVRPLLDVPRSVIEAYAVEHELRWIEDESNADGHFRRNFLRHEILPRLEEKFTGAGQSLARAAGHFAEAAALLDELACIDRDAVRSASGRLALAAFNALPPARARNLLRHVWNAAGFRAPDTRWVDEALKQLSTANALSEVCLATPDGELHVYRGELHIVPLRPLPPELPLPWNGQDVLTWAGGKVRFVPVLGEGLQRSLLVDGLVWLKPRQGGERLQRDARRPRRSLRNLLQETGVPPWERRRLPLLWVNERLAWVAGIGCDAEFACPSGEAGVLPLWEGD